jgi:tetratricopeptide (TPR) repeat protein
MTVKAIDASPTYSGCYQQRGEVLLERAEFAEREGRDADAESELKQADEAIHQANKIDPNDANTALDLGRLSLLRARLLATQKHPADEQLRKAQEQLDAALKLDPKMVDAQIATAQVVQLQSQIESRAGHAAQAQTLIDRAVTELDEVLANEPTRWRALALKASLQIVRADGAKKSEQASLRDEARKELEQALQHEPVLRAEFGALQKRLAQEASKSAPSPSP